MGIILVTVSFQLFSEMKEGVAVYRSVAASCGSALSHSFILSSLFQPGFQGTISLLCFTCVNMLHQALKEECSSNSLTYKINHSRCHRMNLLSFLIIPFLMSSVSVFQLKAPIPHHLFNLF